MAKKNPIVKYFCFPLEEKYRPMIEKNQAEFVNRNWKVVSIIIILSQLMMMFLMITKDGGPHATPRRCIYWNMYVFLLSISCIMWIFNKIFWSKKEKNYRLYLNIETAFAAVLCFWGASITINDQLGGNDLSVFSYMTVLVAALSLLETRKAFLIFTMGFIYLNIGFTHIPSSANNIFSNLINSLFITILSIVVAVNMYRNRVFSCYNEHLINIQCKEITEANNVLNQLVMMDELTKLNNRRYMEEFIVKKESEYQNKSVVLSCMMIDIDYFKKYNDTYGHMAGDECLKTIAKIIRNCCWEEDVCAIRYGGEEFFVCLFKYDKEKAVMLAEAIRSKVATCKFVTTNGEDSSVTVSIGISTRESDEKAGIDELICQSDEALYRAKKNGRNRIEF